MRRGREGDRERGREGESERARESERERERARERERKRERERETSSAQCVRAHLQECSGLVSGTAGSCVPGPQPGFVVGVWAAACTMAWAYVWIRHPLGLR